MGKKILLIDDDPDLVEALRIILESKGYEVDSECEGDAGLKKARSVRPDLVILDVMMKTKDQGFQISYSLKNDPELYKIPILMLTSVGHETGFTFSKDDEDYLKADDMAAKPIKPEDLLLRVKRLTER